MGFLEDVRKLEVVPASTNKQFQQAIEIRRRIYCDEISWLTPETLVDNWDSQAVHLLASHYGRAIATVRINAQKSGLEIEKYINLDNYRSLGKCAEVSRLCALPEIRFSVVTIGMFYALFRYAMANGVRFYCITASPHYRRMYIDLGFKHVAGPFRNKLLNDTLHDAYILDFVGAPLEGPWVEEWAKRRPRMLE